MKYTVQCLCAIYQENTVVVEAHSLGEACALAKEQADDSLDWDASAGIGRTFVFAITKGEHDDAYAYPPLDVPEEHTERGLWEANTPPRD